MGLPLSVSRNRSASNAACGEREQPLSRGSGSGSRPSLGTPVLPEPFQEHSPALRRAMYILSRSCAVIPSKDAWTHSDAAVVRP